MVVRTKIGETDETKHRPVVKKSRMETHRRGMKVVILDWEKIKLARERERERVMRYTTAMMLSYCNLQVMN